MSFLAPLYAFPNELEQGFIEGGLRDRLQIFVSNSYREFVVLYDIDTIFYKQHTN